MFLIKTVRVYNIGKFSAAFSLRGSLCATFPYLQNQLLITEKVVIKEIKVTVVKLEIVANIYKKLSVSEPPETLTLNRD